MATVPMTRITRTDAATVAIKMIVRSCDEEFVLQVGGAELILKGTVHAAGKLVDGESKE